jgi:hypothetical protein
MSVFTDFAVRVGYPFLAKEKIQGRSSVQNQEQQKLNRLTSQVLSVSPVNNYVPTQSIQATVFAFVFSYCSGIIHSAFRAFTLRR